MNNPVKIGDATLYCGDALAILPTLSGVDCVVTDPPYGINHSSSHGASWQDTCIAGDNSTEARDQVLAWANRLGLPWAAFGTWKTPPPAETRGCLVWDKGPAFGMGDLAFPWKLSWELVYIGGEGWRGSRDEGVRRGGVVVSWESKGRVHPHEKPVWFFEYLIRKLPDADTIADPFMGSGTTGVACIRTGRKFIGIERDPRYFEICCRRIQAELDRSRLFVEVDPMPIQADLYGATE